jgi:predicted transcriptional regulator
MPATTIKLPEKLKARIAAVIEGTGTSAHAFMLAAIEEQTALAEKRKAFVAAALAARRRAHKSGKGYAASEVHDYLEARLRNKNAARPKPRSWRK